VREAGWQHEASERPAQQRLGWDRARSGQRNRVSSLLCRAWSFIFGIFASTAFSLLVVPVVYYLIYREKAA